ncbi:MAG: hypothetical protein ACJA2X_000025 [Halocynthiibacter sp.]|jgi:hypothetical protein
MRAFQNLWKPRKPIPNEQPDNTIAKLQNQLAEKVKLATGFHGEVIVKVDKTAIPSLDVRVERRGKNFLLHVPNLNKNDGRMRLIEERAPTAIGWMFLAGPEATEICFHLSDGPLPSLAQCAFSSCDPAMQLVPDYYFFRDLGYEKMRAWVRNNDVPWAARNSDLVWRGRLTGVGLFSLDPMQKDNPLVRQRLRAAMHARGSRLDFRFVSAITPIEEHILSEAGYLTDVIKTTTWIGSKFAVDIDGFSNTWDNIFHRFLMGNCVLKVESQAGFRQWYYDRLQPFKNYVPIKKDLSDLHEKIDWVLNNDERAQEIAQEGKALAESLTWDAVAQETAQNLRNLAGKRK